jgi:TonB family protein
MKIGRFTILTILIAAMIAASLAAAAAGQKSVKPEAPPPRLISELRSKNAGTRRDAANDLGSIRARGAVRALVETLSDRDSMVREAAAFALGQIADPAGTGLLIPLLADPNSEVRASAAFALGMIGERKSLDALSYATGDREPEVRSAAIVALGLMQDAGGVDEVTDALDDSSYDVRYDAVWALGQIGEPDVEERLRGMSLDRDGVDDAWREAYGQALKNSLESLRTEAHARLEPDGQTRARRATGIISENRYANTTRVLAVRESVRAATTERASKAKVNGKVKLRVLVGADGRVVRAYVTRRLGYGLDQRAVEAVLQYKFDPEMLGGLPQTTWVDLEIKFGQ